VAKKIARNLRRNNINILYVIGGDGSLSMAHEIAEFTKKDNISIVGIPKTMDNDILWVWQSFGFRTAVKRATEVVNILHTEAKSTRRIGIIQLFGARSGFVAANTTLASGYVDLVLIPEQFINLNSKESENGLKTLLDWFIQMTSKKDHRIPCHGIVVLAEGVGEILMEKKVKLLREPINKANFVKLIEKYLKKEAHRCIVQIKGTFINEPRHYIRAAPPNAQDLIYCVRLGTLAVDNALAGYTDFMVSQWLTEFVLVPLKLVTVGQKCVPTDGMFWKQVLSSTRQPSIFPKRTKKTNGPNAAC
jgi:6-phosphofructokinase 1